MDNALLRKLTEAGLLGLLDVQFALSLNRVSNEENEQVLLAAALCCHLAQRGHLCLDLQKPDIHLEPDELGVLKAPQDDVAFAWPTRESFEQSLEGSVIVSDGTRFTPLVLEDGLVYLRRLWDYQQRLTSEVKGRILKGGADGDLALLERRLHELFPSTNSDEESAISPQKAAVRNALSLGLSVIVGGPGTGKTSVVVKIVALLIEQLQRAGRDAPRVLLTAPTGKAAQRLSESVRRASGRLPFDSSVLHLIPDSATTIHRVLAPRGRTKDSGSLPYDVVVVDESSMVDLALMTRLLESISPNAKVILLGDRHQLASVEAGAVLGDICSGLATEVTELTHSYRFAGGSGIGTLAGAINGGDASLSLAVLHDASFKDVTFSSLEQASSFHEIIATYAERYFEPIFGSDEPSKMLAGLEQLRVLTARRRGPFGAEAVNSLVEAYLRSQSMDISSRWYKGRPVLLTSNDYELELFNGDVGVAAYRYDGSLRVYFERAGADGDLGMVDVSPALLPPSETAFAMTIHKSQGSEFDHVLVVLPDDDSPLLTRELLYTAVTRARKSVHIVGAEGAIARAVESPTVRLSGLPRFLKR